MQKADSNSSAGYVADSIAKDENLQSSSHDTKPNVSGLPLSTPEIQSVELSLDGSDNGVSGRLQRSWFFKWVKGMFITQKIYFEGRFISKRKYINTLSKRYRNMLKHIQPGTAYPTWE